MSPFSGAVLTFVIDAFLLAARRDADWWVNSWAESGLLLNLVADRRLGISDVGILTSHEGLCRIWSFDACENKSKL